MAGLDGRCPRQLAPKPRISRRKTDAATFGGRRAARLCRALPRDIAPLAFDRPASVVLLEAARLAGVLGDRIGHVIAADLLAAIAAEPRIRKRLDAGLRNLRSASCAAFQVRHHWLLYGALRGRRPLPATRAAINAV